MIWRMNRTRIPRKLSFASWLSLLKFSGSDIVWTVGMFRIVPVGYLLGYTIGMLLLFSLVNAFGTWEIYLVGVTLVTLGSLMIFTGEIFLVVLSLVLSLVYPPEYPNAGAVLCTLFVYLSEFILCMSLGNPLVLLCKYIWNISWCGPRLGS